MFLSIGFAAVGVVGGLYNLAVSGVALQNGPLCDFVSGGWIAPFREGWMSFQSMVYRISFWVKFVHQFRFLHRDGSYLTKDSLWKDCIEPDNIVQFHIGMFATLLVIGGLEIILCAIQMVNGLVGCLCGTCGGKEVCWSTLSVHYAVRATLLKKNLILNSGFSFQAV